MAITLSTGVAISIASTYEAADTVSAITNAAEAVCTTSAPHGISPGDYVEVTSGWDLLDKRVVRAGAATTGSSLVLENIDTSNTTKYPAGTGIGSVRKISAWTQMSQVKSISASGGSQNYADITDIASQVEKKIPTTRAAIDMTLDVFDDPTLAWYDKVETADEARVPYGLKMAFPNGSVLVGNTYWSLMRVPTITQNEALMSQISLSYAAEPVRYAT